jgi:hypothetical protein
MDTGVARQPARTWNAVADGVEDVPAVQNRVNQAAKPVDAVYVLPPRGAAVA